MRPTGRHVPGVWRLLRPLALPVNRLMDRFKTEEARKRRTGAGPPSTG